MMMKQIVCNCCGKEFEQKEGVLKEECVEIRHSFGYFSKKDTVIHRFRLCEDCYDKMVSRFKVPVEVSEEKEVFPAFDF